jgi:hypothetical protein
MRRGSIFWGGILILLGVLFSLKAANLITDVFGWFWPLLLILFGVAVLVNRFVAPSLSGGGAFSIDLQGAAKVALDIDHGAGSIKIKGGAPIGTALAGTKGVAFDLKSHLNGETLTVDIDAGPTFIPFIGPEGGVWVFQLTNEVPVSLKVDAGASTLDFDFTDVKLEFIGVDTGASSLTMKMPANAGRTLVDVESGAATIDITIPEGVAARIRLEQGVSAQNINLARFPNVTESLYQSAEFDTAANRVEINLEGGANTVNIR